MCSRSRTRSRERSSSDLKVTLTAEQHEALGQETNRGVEDTSFTCAAGTVPTGGTSRGDAEGAAVLPGGAGERSEVRAGLPRSGGGVQYSRPHAISACVRSRESDGRRDSRRRARSRVSRGSDVLRLRPASSLGLAGAKTTLLRAIELNPRYAQAHTFHAWLLSTLDRPVEAAESARIGQELEPFFTGDERHRGARVIPWSPLRSGDSRRASPGRGEPKSVLALLCISTAHEPRRAQGGDRSCRARGSPLSDVNFLRGVLGAVYAMANETEAAHAYSTIWSSDQRRMYVGPRDVRVDLRPPRRARPRLRVAREGVRQQRLHPWVWAPSPNV